MADVVLAVGNRKELTGTVGKVGKEFCFVTEATGAAAAGGPGDTGA